MALFTRRAAPPADAVVTLSREDRVLSWADVAEDRAVLASTRGLWWPEPVGQRLIGWELINKAVWREGMLSVIEAAVLDDLLIVDQPALSVRLTVPRDLPATVRRRVQANVVRSELRTLRGGAARFVARRVPGRDGVRWWARLEPGTPDTDDVRIQVRAELDELSRHWARAED